MRQMDRKIRILVIATNRWFSIGQFLSALIRVGFEVAIICPPGNPIEHIRNLSARYKYRSWRSENSIRNAIADWKPALLVCNDDVAVRELHKMYRQACIETSCPESAALVNLIQLSLGDPRSFAISTSKSRQISVALTLKIACPPTTVLNAYQDLDRHLGHLIYPALVKSDQSWGGRGVRTVHTDRELLQAILELSFPHDWPKSLKWLVARALTAVPVVWRPPLPQDLNFQSYIGGRPANRAVVCWQGKILAGITVEAIETDSEFGPTTLARIIEHAEITETAEKIVESQRLSGFLGFDFVLDHANRAWFLEMNPRVTPACHLRFRAPSLAAALFLKLTGEQPSSEIREVPEDMIALFPNRVSTKSGQYSYFDDVPEEEPAFVKACRRAQFRRKILGWRKFGGGRQINGSARKSPIALLPEGTNDI